MTKYEAMQARVRKAGLWPISKEQAYYAGIEEGSAHVTTDNSAVVERLERENRELRAMLDKPLREIKAEAVDAALREYAQQWIEPQVKGPFPRELVYADIIDHADRLAELRSGEENE